MKVEKKAERKAVKKVASRVADLADSLDNLSVALKVKTLGKIEADESVDTMVTMKVQP